MVVHIEDCEVFRENNPQVFEDCGWNSCHKDPFDIFSKVPQSEYNLWIPELTSPLSIVEWLKSHKCFSGMLSPVFDLSKEKNQILSNKKGMTIKLFGFTPNTQSSSECGLAAIKNLLPVCFQVRETMAFQKLTSELIRIGYVSGVNLQGMPYNFFYG